MTRPSDATRSAESDSSSAPNASAPNASAPNGSARTTSDSHDSAPTAVIPAVRQPPAGPAPAARPGGPYRPPPPRFAPPPPRRLTSAQGSRLGLIAAVIVLLGAAAGLAIALLLPTEYAARTNIEYTVAKENASDFLRTDRNLTTQSVLLTSRTVLAPVADANGLSPDALADKVTATIVLNSEIIQVDVRDANRQVGVRLADAIGKRYLEVVDSSGPKGYVQEQLDEARRDLATAPVGLLGSPAAITRANIQTRVNTLQGQLDTINLTGNRAAVVVPAHSLTAPAFPNSMLAAATGALTGLVVAGLVAIALSRRWTRSPP